MTNDNSTQELIQAVNQANSDDRLLAAVRALAACQTDAAIPTLIAVFGYNNPGAAMIAVEALIALGEAAVMPLVEQLDEYNYGARAYSIRTLAAIAAPRALDTLVAAAVNDFAPSVRRAAAKGLGNLHWHQLSAEAATDAQTTALNTLIQVSQDSDWAIRYAAIVGLQALAKSANSTTLSIKNLFKQLLASEADTAVRSRVLMALQQLPAPKQAA
ncbi:MAG: HEAT repeat domain-containing protein [Coleofasciculaceae cyanobacterium]